MLLADTLQPASIRSFEPSDDGCFVSTPEPVDPAFVEFYYTKLCEGQAWIVDADSIAPAVRTVLQAAYAALNPLLQQATTAALNADDASSQDQILLSTHTATLKHTSRRWQPVGLGSRLSSLSRRMFELATRRSPSSLQQQQHTKSGLMRHGSHPDIQSSFFGTFSGAAVFHQMADVANLTALYRGKFAALRVTHPESFEYVLLPNRVLDNRLAPLPFVLFFNMLYCTVFLCVCLFRVVGTDLHWFDRYQVVFYLFFNSTAIGSLAVDCVMRPLLLRRNLWHDPYIRVTLVFVAMPFLTHCLPAAVYYCWIFVPLMGIPVAFETWLRHQKQLTLQRNRVIAFTLRSTARIVLVFCTCASLSMSYNYAAIGIWNRAEAASSLNILPSLSYVDIPQVDFESRSFLCMVQEWFSSTAAFFQHFATIIGLF